jgi:hypothetical protein
MGSSSEVAHWLVRKFFVMTAPWIPIDVRVMTILRLMISEQGVIEGTSTASGATPAATTPPPGRAAPRTDVTRMSARRGPTRRKFRGS